MVTLRLLGLSMGYMITKLKASPGGGVMGGPGWRDLRRCSDDEQNQTEVVKNEDNDKEVPFSAIARHGYLLGVNAQRMIAITQKGCY